MQSAFPTTDLIFSGAMEPRRGKGKASNISRLLTKPDTRELKLYEGGRLEMLYEFNRKESMRCAPVHQRR
jgi:hypothetical protein